MKIQTVFFLYPADSSEVFQRTLELDFVPHIGMSMDIDGNTRRVEDVVYLHGVNDIDRYSMTASEKRQVKPMGALRRLEVYFEAEQVYTIEDLRRMGWE